MSVRSRSDSILLLTPLLPDIRATVNIMYGLRTSAARGQHDPGDQLPDRGISGGFLQGHSLARLYASDDAGAFLAGLIGGQPSVLAQGDPLRAAEGAGLHNVDLRARRVDPNAETRKVAVPEHGVLALDRQTVDNSFGEGDVLCSGHAMVPKKPSLRMAEPEHTVNVSKASDMKLEDIQAHQRRRCKPQDGSNCQTNILEYNELWHVCAQSRT